MNNVMEVREVILIGLSVANFLVTTSRTLKAIELYKECLVILNNIAVIMKQKSATFLYKTIYGNMWQACSLVHDKQNAIKYLEKIIRICRQCGERSEECELSIKLAKLYFDQSNYKEAKELWEKVLVISKETGDRETETACYGNLGVVYQSVAEYQRSREYLEKSLAITKEIGVRKGEAYCYINLGNVLTSVGENRKAREHYEKSLEICKEIGDRRAEAFCYGKIGVMYYLGAEYQKAREYHETSLAICKEIGARTEEAFCYETLGVVYQKVGEYQKGREYLEKSLAIRKEIGNRNAEAACYLNLGDGYLSLGEYQKARRYYEKSLAISKEIDDRGGEAICYDSLGSVYRSVGEYEKAREYHDKSLVITNEIGSRGGEGAYYRNLGGLCKSVGEYHKAREYYEKSLAIVKEIGDRNGEAACYGNLAYVHLSLDECQKAREYYEKSLTIVKEIGNRNGEAACYGNLGDLYESLGEFQKAREYLQKSLAINKSIFSRAGEAANYTSLGTLFCNLGEYVKAEEYIKKGLAISEEIGDVPKQFVALNALASLREKEGKVHEAISCFQSATEICEHLRSSLLDNDQFKISFSDCHIHSYQQLSALLCGSGKPNDALYVAELGRGSALTDLMSAHYSEEKQIFADPDTWAGIEKVMDNERNCTCLYVSYFFDIIYLWIIKASGVTHFRQINGRELIAQEGLVGDLDDFFGSESFRSFGILPEELCEDRSLNFSEQETESCMEDSLGDGLRIGKESEDSQGPKMDLPLCYKLIIAPVVDLLEGPEIIIVPDRSLYNIPFAALPDKKEKCLSETFRIRLVPSLTTLKLIHDSPADYHSQTGALIVGNPKVGVVNFKGKDIRIRRLPGAENEAKMIGKMLGVKPLLGRQATKQAMLEVINSVSLIHLAAHGDAERGEIALAPARRTPGRTPQEKDYLLTMSDISKVRLRAKLVVLSCCHSARGKIKAEGAVGIARALLGSGARSVLVSLWAVEDDATDILMRRFYKCLVRGESASESLHNAMQRTRRKGYSHVSQWAPFVLIGDNVTFDFEKQGFAVAKKDQGTK